MSRAFSAATFVLPFPSPVYRGSQRRSVASLPSAREGNEILCTLYYEEDEKSDY